MTSGDGDRSGQGASMQNWTDNTALLRAVEIDAAALVPMLYELTRRVEGIAPEAAASIEALLDLLDTIVAMDDGEAA